MNFSGLEFGVALWLRYVCVCSVQSVPSDSFESASWLLCPWDFPDKDTEVGCHFLLQGIFLTQVSNPVSLACVSCVARQILCHLSRLGKPYVCAYLVTCDPFKTSLVAQMVKRLSTVQETWVRSLGRENCLEKEMATHSSTLAQKIPRTEDSFYHLSRLGSPMYVLINLVTCDPFKDFFLSGARVFQRELWPVL